MNKKATRRQIQIIHVKRKQIGIDHDTHVDILRTQYNAGSSLDLTEAQARNYIRYLEKKGAKSTRPRKKGSTLSSEEYIFLLWKQLGDKGLLKKPGKASCNSFALSRFGVSHVSWLDKRQKSQMIEALKSMKERK